MDIYSLWNHIAYLYTAAIVHTFILKTTNMFFPSLFGYSKWTHPNQKQTFLHNSWPKNSQFGIALCIFSQFDWTQTLPKIEKKIMNTSSFNSNILTRIQASNKQTNKQTIIPRKYTKPFFSVKALKSSMHQDALIIFFHRAGLSLQVGKGVFFL